MDGSFYLSPSFPEEKGLIRSLYFVPHLTFVVPRRGTFSSHLVEHPFYSLQNFIQTFPFSRKVYVLCSPCIHPSILVIVDVTFHSAIPTRSLSLSDPFPTIYLFILYWTPSSTSTQHFIEYKQLSNLKNNILCLYVCLTPFRIPKRFMF